LYVWGMEQSSAANHKNGAQRGLGRGQKCERDLLLGVFSLLRPTGGLGGVQKKENGRQLCLYECRAPIR